MASYKTPGVYVEEISKFPPSVAQVETAIPAFIGFTQVAKRKIAGDLHLKPTRITSMLEYETYFGFAKPEKKITVTVIGSEVIANGPGVNRSPYLMYYSMQIYFANGGGPCYITSVGQYDGNALPLVEIAPLSLGLAAVRKEDEPTLLVLPDATSLSSAIEFYAIYGDALTQCNQLQDRFTIIDTYTDQGGLTPVSDLRMGITLSNEYLKYGAAYYPFLETILDYQYKNVDVVVNINGAPSTAQEARNLMTSISTTSLQTILDGLVVIEGLVGTATVAVSKNNLRTNINSAIQYLNDLKATSVAILLVGRAELLDPATIAASDALDAWITSTIETLLLKLAQHLDVLNAIGSATNPANRNALTTLITVGLTSIYDAFGLTDPMDIPSTTILVDINASIILGGTINNLVFALDGITPVPSVTNLADIADPLNPLHDNLLYNRIKSAIGQLPVKLPPSSAMAGIYARVDGLRGVWKAPANVGLSYVISPSVIVTHDEQADMNVTTTGKSVNAIRSFTGKGTLVWGARTLAGNDNEWRYVPVRRFFNMVEESVKKASEQFVFEPNDANTWVRLSSMIENFLTLQWRAGALTGAKPDQAYYVNIGLGKTMTADDILNGYMIIEIGMAVVRPAEFIVLRFSHKMAEA